MHGEIYLAGAGVSLGYLNNKELTDHHFMHNPYATPFYIEQGWTRMYRTGDIGQLHEDGALVFHNRIAGDTQIKIRGLRIELADIESNIVQTSGGALKEAVVTLREGDGDADFLVAHVVFAPDHKVSDQKAFLATLLKDLPVPQYMIPVMAIPLDNMPLTNHSKTDRKALKAMPLPQSTGSSGSSDELSETMLQLRRVWQELLGARATHVEITPSTDFFTVGGNSLLIVRLQSRIRAVFKVTIRLFELLQSSTLAAIAQQIEQSSSVIAIDWQRETALPDVETLPVEKTPIKTTDKVVLITGAGGFLGKHILAELVADTKVSKIHCIALREKVEGTPRELAISSPKIVTHAGDLSEAWLGLPEDTFWALAGEVDSILHMGAVRSFWDNYNILRQSNVTPTKQLVKLAAARQIPIHYTSTAGVVSDDAVGLAAGSAAANTPATDGSNGYVASRWASEQILEHATADLGVPTTIHRFVPAKSASPETTAPALDEILSFVYKIGLKPDFVGWSGHFEMMPAKQAAIILSNGLTGNSTEAATNFQHHENNVSIDLADMLAFIEQKTAGKEIGTMPGLKYFGRMKALGLSYFLTSQDLTVQSTAEGQTDTLETKR